MFAKNTFRSLVTVRGLATEATASEKTPSSMNSLLSKLAAITENNVPSGAGTMVKKIPKKQNRNAARGEKKEFKRNNDRRDKDNNKKFSNNTTRRNNNNTRNDEKRGFSNSNRSSFGRTEQTVSHYDKFHKAKAASTLANPSLSASSSASFLNNEGLSFAEIQKQRALYIRRKNGSTESKIELSTPEVNVLKFIASRALHKAENYDLRSNSFAKFSDPSNKYTVPVVSKPELELLKDKLAYDTKSRLLRALEQITTKRGFKLLDVNKSNVKYLPYTALLYPFANTTLPNNLDRPVANIKSLSNISPVEIQQTIDTVVKGKRQELIFDSNKNYKTAQLKVNAQVVVNALNSNSQFQVDNLHTTMAKVMVGEQPIKNLPEPILPPKKV